MNGEARPQPTKRYSLSGSQWRAMRPFVFASVVGIVGGGVVAALTRPFGFDEGPWVAAYLVLVVGVAQLGFAVGQEVLSAAPPSARSHRRKFLLYNVGSLAVIVGTLAEAVLVVVIGGVMLVVVLVLFLGAVRGSRGDRWCLVFYRSLAVVLAGGILVGSVLSLLRHG